MKTISERQKSILYQIVETYIETALPVGSEVLRDRYHLKYSSATLRNEMGALVHEGYLTQPHTSSGRIPTDEGYRQYVNQILSSEANQSLQYRDIEGSLIDYSHEVDEPEFFVEGISEWLSRLTRETSIVYLTNPFNSLVRHTRLGIQDRRFYLQGSSYILEKPEFRDVDKIRLIFRALEEKNKLMEWMTANLNNKSNVTVRIGKETDYQAFEDCSIVAAHYFLGDEHAGTIALLGATRMQYIQTVPLIAKVAQVVEKILNEKYR